MDSVSRAATCLASATIAVATLVAVAAPAQASCALPPKSSPYTFTGTVVSVERDNRVAQVRTDAGRDVTVHGGPDVNSSAATSVDRHFVVGGRYEFHPLDGSDPYEDNACTATRQLSGPAPAAAEHADDRLPGWLPVDESAGLLGYAGLAGLVLAVLLSVGAVVLGLRGVLRSDRVGTTVTGHDA